MWPILVVAGDPGVKIGLQLLDAAVDPLAERDLVELLQDANFTYADLRGAKFECADLKGASLTGAQLQGALLDDAKPQDASLDCVQLLGANAGR